MTKHVFRFFAEKSDVWKITDEDEIHHATKVLRLRSGDAVEIMDGRGTVAHAVISEISRDAILLSNVTDALFLEKSEMEKTLLIGMLRANDVNSFLSSLVELGADRIIFFGQKHTEKFKLKDDALFKFQRTVRNAVKQCKRPYLPEVEIVPDVRAACLKTRGNGAQAVLLPGSSTGLGQWIVSKKMMQSFSLAIGSESGFDAEEIAVFESSGFEKVHLGPAILRAETAALAAASLLLTLTA